nr:replication associated protein [Flumine genomovirus 5]
MPFQLCTKHGLLTYAQCENLDAFKVVARLSELGAECIVGREIHEDGGTHLHVFFAFEGKFRTRNERIFDVDGYHPNIVRSWGTPEKGWDYATKDGDVVAGGLERPSGSGDNETKNKWAFIIQADTRDEFWTRVEECDPRSMACNYGNLAKYCEWKYRPEFLEYEHPEGISFIQEQTEDLREWAAQNVGGDVTGKKLWLWVENMRTWGVKPPGSSRARP